MGNAFVKIAIYIFVPHIMTFTNKCHLCKITKSYEGQECRNHNAAKPQNFTMIKDAKITKLSNIQTVNSILVVTSYHTKAIMRIVLKKKEKKIDGTCFCKDCNLFLCTPCNDVHKQVPPLQILQGPRMPKSQSCKITEFCEDQGCQSTIQSCQIYRWLPS